MDLTNLLPPRYEPLTVLGKGGGGQVWSVRDRVTGESVALKTLHEGASSREVQALVREAVTLSGVEGLGVPRVLRFGTLKLLRQPYLVRELVQGRSLLDVLEGASHDPIALLEALIQTAHQLTIFHRAGLLHGDIKPANIVVGDAGRATLVDLGLSARWLGTGATVEGFTPQYAAPELLSGSVLTVRAEVYALGATLSDVLAVSAVSLASDRFRSLQDVCSRAMSNDPTERFPSVDEFANAIATAARIRVDRTREEADAVWPIVGLDVVSARLLDRLGELASGEVLTILGPARSGRSTLLRRVAWSLGAEGRQAIPVEQLSTEQMEHAIELELGGVSNIADAVFLIDGAERLSARSRKVLANARQLGAKLVTVESQESARTYGGKVHGFPVSLLEDTAAHALVQRAIPSLPPAIVAHVSRCGEGCPGRLRAIVHQIGNRPIVSIDEVNEAILSSEPPRQFGSPYAQVEHLLDLGHFEQASAILAEDAEESPERLLSRVRLALGQGKPSQALELLDGHDEIGRHECALLANRWRMLRGRTLLRLGRFPDAVQAAQSAADASGSPELDAVALESMAVAAMARSYLGDHEGARRDLVPVVESGRVLAPPRIRSIVLGSLAFCYQQEGNAQDARRFYEMALSAGEEAGDAGAVANTRLNLGVLARVAGDLAEASRHLEASIDLGLRSGRTATTRQAQLNLANVDIYLGRYARARTHLEMLAADRDLLPSGMSAQLIGLEADLAARVDHPRVAAELYQTCARAYDALERPTDAAEARLEGVLALAWAPSAEHRELGQWLDEAENSLRDSTAHRALLYLAKGAVASARDDSEEASQHYASAIQAAQLCENKDWEWRAHDARSRLASLTGRDVAAKRDSEAALAILEEIAAKLPRDLREVYWDDPRRKAVRKNALGLTSSVRSPSTANSSATSKSYHALSHAPTMANLSGYVLPIEERLAKLLEINRSLAREHSLQTVLDHVTDHAISLVQAERGLVILSDDGQMVAHTSRSRGTELPDAGFSRSIAEQVIRSGEPVVTTHARSDSRMVAFASVHQQQVESVACVPIRAPDGRTRGALYLETRNRPGPLFHAEVPFLSAFADQAAVAIENARLLEVNRQHVLELETMNRELLAARERLQQSLGARTEQLKVTRRDLHATRAVLDGKFGYHGIVGTSLPMRNVYAIIDRVRDMDVPVLLTGESGTGKEVVAKAIHRAGPNAKHPFTGINCGAIPQHLLESELFGNVKGAFTGADRDRKGLLRESEGGTVLLDEIGEMPPKMQAGLLRVLQERLVRPVGGTDEVPVSVRIIAATHRDIKQMVAAGTFREDLYYRLHVVDIHLPSLRERVDDIPALIDHFLTIFAKRYEREKKRVSREALRALSDYSWPGNVRQLENTLLNSWVMSEGDELTIDDFAVLRERGKDDDSSSAGGSGLRRRSSVLTSVSLSSHESAEKGRILAALSKAKWNRVKAAELVGMPRRTFYRRLQKYGIS